MAEISKIQPFGSTTQYDLRDTSKLPLTGGTMTGTIILAQTGLKTPNDHGYITDNCGNFKHQTTDTSHFWHLDSNDGTAKFKVTWESGNTEISGTLATKGITTAYGGLEVKGHIAGDSGTSGHGLYSGGAYHNAYNNIILHGDASTGTSGIAFVSDKVNTSTGTITTINQPSDRAFIQYHACGVTTTVGENADPTLMTSGERGRFVIGVGNDAGTGDVGDQLYLQTRGRTDALRFTVDNQILGVIPDTGNTTGTVGSSTRPVYIAGGAITQTGTSLDVSITGNATTASRLNISSTDNAIARFDGTNGTIQDSGIIIDDNNLLKTNNIIQTDRYFHNVLTYSCSSTPKEILIKTNFPFTNGNEMPKIILHTNVYSSGTPTELSLVFYVYSGAFCNYGVTSNTNWRPKVSLSTYTKNNAKYVAIGLGLIGTENLPDSYYIRFNIDVLDIWADRNYASGWTVETNTGDTSIIPTDDRKILDYKDKSAMADKLSNTPNNTTTFLRGDNTWSNQLGSYIFNSNTDMPETAANISTINTAHHMTFYRNAILMPYQMDNTNDGGFIRCRGTTESSTTIEMSTWDDGGSGETIQFNYYPTTSMATPTYSVSVPKATGTICLTNGTGASGTWGISITGNATTASRLNITSTDDAIARFDGTNGTIQDSTATINDKGTMIIKGKLVVNPSYDTTSNSFNEGIRINQASNGWAEVMLGGTKDSTAGSTSSAWIVGRRGASGSQAGAVGDFTIEEFSNGDGLTIHQSSGGATLYANKAVLTPVFTIKNVATSDSSWQWLLNAISPNMQAGSNNSLAIGQSNSTKNQAYIGFHYAGNSSDNNYLTLGLYSIDNAMVINGLGNVGIGTTSPGYKLTIENGPIKVHSTTTNNRLPMNSGLTGDSSYGTADKYGTIIYSNGISMRDPYTGNGNDCGFIRHIETTTNSGYLEVGVGDDGTESIYARQYNTSSTVAAEITLLNASHESEMRTIVPKTNDTYTLGITSNRWHDICGTNIYANTIRNINDGAKIRLCNNNLINTSTKKIGSEDNLTTSDNEDEWLKALLKAICETYPNESGIFRGKIDPNSVLYYEIYIYNTGAKDSTTGLPQYSFGTYSHYSTSHGVFGTASYSFFRQSIVKADGGTWGINITGNATTATQLQTAGTTGQFYRGDRTWSNTLIGGLEIKGHIAGDSGTTGYGLYSGGAYHNAYNNIILHGDASTGSSGIAFVSDKVSSDGTVTTINQPSDRAFIQYHACGVTTMTAEGTAPTLATSGEIGRLVIGVGNDAGAASPGDQLYLQTRGRTDALHLTVDNQVLGVIPDTGNTTGTVGSSSQPVYINGGAITAISALAMANGGTGNAYGLLPNNKGASNVSIAVGTWQPKTSTKYKYVWQQKWTVSDFTYTSGDSQITNTDTADIGIWLSGSETSNNLTANMNIDGKIYSLGGFEGNLSGNAATATALTSNAGSSSVPIYFSGGKPVQCSTTLGVSITGNAATATTATNATNIYSSASTSKAYVLGTLTASSANHGTVYNASVYTQGTVLYGAAWNDYAEYREAPEDDIEAGRCVREVGDDTLVRSTERLQKGCEIVSDTYGFAIGQTEKANTPIAVTGRVLAYVYEGREVAKEHIGDCVCSGPDGTVSIMTEEEERMYPGRIIGTISAVPDYEIWNETVKVNGRVWIRI